jgi:hypothetical protein
VVEVGAGEELTIETEWDVKAPAHSSGSRAHKWERKQTCHVWTPYGTIHNAYGWVEG